MSTAQAIPVSPHPLPLSLVEIRRESAEPHLSECCGFRSASAPARTAETMHDPQASVPIVQSPYDRLSSAARQDLLSSFLRLELALPDLAQSHGLSFDEFLAFFDDPRVKAILDNMEKLARRRTSVTQSLLQHQALETLRLITSAYLASESSELPPAGLPARSALHRQRETARRAASTLLRHVGDPMPARTRPAACQASDSCDYSPAPHEPSPEPITPTTKLQRAQDSGSKPVAPDVRRPFKLRHDAASVRGRQEVPQPPSIHSEAPSG